MFICRCFNTSITYIQLNHIPNLLRPTHTHEQAIRHRRVAAIAKAKSYSTSVQPSIKVTPLPLVSFGANVTGIACDGGLSPTTVAWLRSLLYRRGILVLRGRSDRPATPASMLRFLEQFEPIKGNVRNCRAPVCAVPGSPYAHMGRKCSEDGYPMVRRIGNIRDATGAPTALLCRTGCEWHIDGGHSTTLLCCVQAPRYTTHTHTHTHTPHRTV